MATFAIAGLNTVAQTLYGPQSKIFTIWTFTLKNLKFANFLV